MGKKSAQGPGGRRRCPGGRPSTVKNGREEHPHDLEEHSNVLEERQSTAKNGREEHPHDLEERGNALEERQSAVKNGLEEHYPVWGFKNLKAGRGLV